MGLRKGRNKGNATYNPGCVCLPFLDRECPGMSLDILLDYTPFCGHFVGCGKGTGSTKGYVKNTTPVAIQTLYNCTIVHTLVQVHWYENCCTVVHLYSTITRYCTEVQEPIQVLEYLSMK